MKIDFLRFEYRVLSAQAQKAFKLLVMETMKAHDVRVLEYGNALIHASRNKAISEIRPDADYALFCDDDMLPEPAAVMKLLAHNEPVVSAVCTNKTPPVELVAKIYDERLDRYVPFDWIKPDKLLIGQIAVGAAFLLMSREVINILIEHYLSAADWLEDHRPEMDRMRVRGPFREAERVRKAGIRRRKYHEKKELRIFDFPVIDNEDQLGEDICLSRRLMQCKIPVALDSNVVVGHLGEYGYGPWDIQPKDETQVA